MTDDEIRNSAGDAPSDAVGADPFEAFLIQLDDLITWTGAVVGRALDVGSTAPLDEAIDSIDEQLPRDFVEPQFDALQDMWVAGCRAARGRLLLERYRSTSRLADLAQALRDCQASLEDSWANEAVPAPASCLAAYHDARALALAEQFNHTETFAQLVESIGHEEEAVRLRPEQPLYRAHLAIGYADRRRARLNPAPDDRDLERAIEEMAEAVRQTAPDDVNRAAWEGDLGAFHLVRFAQSRDGDDIGAAIDLTTLAIARTLGTSDVVSHLLSRARAFRARFELTGNPNDQAVAIRDYLEAVRTGEAFVSPYGLDAAGALAFWAAQRASWTEVVEAGERGLGTLDQLVERQARPADKEPWVRNGVGISAETAYAYAQLGRLDDAVLAAERGRALILSDRFPDIRPYLARLTEEGHSDLAARFRDLGAQLADADRSDDELMDLARERRTIMATIREIAGEGVAAPESVGEIFAASPDVTVCYLIPASTGGLALVVRGDHSISKLLLPMLTIENLNRRFGAYSAAVLAEGSDLRTRAAGVVEIGGWLGEAVMGPLSEALAEGTRAALIPASLLGLLPLHAGWWTVDGKRHYAIEDRVWTYEASARGHRVARERADQAVVDRVLAVEAPAPVNLARLKAASTEIDAVVRHFRHRRRLKGPKATHARVVQSMAGQDVVHFACHGFADTYDPMRSGLIMAHDEPLLLAQILDLPGLDRIRLTVLSACQTSVSSDRLPDESTSLAVGMLFAGSAAVVGSLWNVLDHATAELMGAFYDHWRRERMEPAEALRQAQLSLIRSGQFASDLPTGWDEPHVWGAFAYYGA